MTNSPAQTLPPPEAAETAHSLACEAAGLVVDATVVPVLRWLETFEGAAAVATLARIRAMIDGTEAVVLARATQDCDDERDAARVASGLLGTEASRADRQRRLQRSRTVQASSELGEKLQRGETTAEHLDALAPALAADPAALEDTELVDAALGATADQARRIARDWVDRHANEREIAERVKREQAQRNVYKFTGRNSGLDTIAIEGDHISMKRLWQRIEAEADRLWRQDGGRDVKPREHPRTHQQRMFDAAYNLLTDAATSTTGRPALVVTIPIDKFTGSPERAAIDIGTGPLPDAMLADLATDADLYAMIADMTGRPLWLGRSRRHATRDQFIALVVRDKGCVACAADWRRCQAHHLTPWNSPARGRTDIDDLGLDCDDDHRRIHENKLTQFRKPDGTFATRPATPDEIAPSRPTLKRRRQQGRRPPPKRELGPSDDDP